ncbi:MAG: hypothetical protein HUN04_14075 [Desulfobacter sp.]|nr:MAG: hypothetical protein HUN04_14075 [Desulfobacter sp.]
MDLITTVVFNETAGINRHKEPVTWGMPFPKGMVRDISDICIIDDAKEVPAFFSTPLAHWADGSIKWILFDSQLSVGSYDSKPLYLYYSTEKSVQPIFSKLKCQESEKKIIILTGIAEFHIVKNPFIPFSEVFFKGKQIIQKDSGGILLESENGSLWEPSVDGWHIETYNPLRCVLAFNGKFHSQSGSIHPLSFICKLHFYADKAETKVEFTLLNTSPARHLGGVWDLGDKGSIFFEALSVNIQMLGDTGFDLYYTRDNYSPVVKETRPVTIYQDSSGGKNWYSRNHVNKNNKIPLTFQGYKITSDGEQILDGLRANPFMAMGSGEYWVGAGVRNFWQNFPKEMAFSDGLLSIGLFPKQFNDLFELQGGEQKTHIMDLYLGHSRTIRENVFPTFSPLVPEVSPDWYYNSGECSRPLPTQADDDPFYQSYNEMIQAAVNNETSFVQRREIIDEFGWRNFGELYADHEAVFQDRPERFISHYNNQFDVIMGSLTQFFRTGDRKWFDLAREHADHVCDIDIYHTRSDRFQFNNGLFWHTDHHLDAATCTHRSVSVKHRDMKPPHLVGGGPSYDHCYTTGFLYMYWLTGEIRYRDSVLALAENVVYGLKGPDTISEFLFILLRKGLAKRHAGNDSPILVYGLKDGPGRASGNALNVLLDAFLLCGDQIYLRHAESLIRICISPDDLIESRQFCEVELRWMYTVFLKSLCRYVELKEETQEKDDMYNYVCAVLLKYGEWMVDNEYPYLDKPEILEFPNESWAAQEFRKSDVLAFTACLSHGEMRTRMMEKGRFFFEEGIKGMQRFDNWILTRPLVLMMRNGIDHLDLYFKWKKGELTEFADSERRPVATEVNKGSNLISQLKDILRRTTPAKELKWIWYRVEDKLKI